MSKGSAWHLRSALTTTCLSLATLAVVRADSVVVGGLGTSSTHQSIYAGWVAALPGQQFGNGWIYSLFADSMRYRYDAVGTRIQTSAPGVNLGVGREFTLESTGIFSLSIQGGSRDTTLRPKDSGNRNAGFKVDPGMQLQWRADDSLPIASTVFASYTLDRASYYAKGFAGLRTNDGWAIGPESKIQGDRSYEIIGTGLAVHGIRFSELRVGVNLGVEFQPGRNKRLAGGLEFSYSMK